MVVLISTKAYKGKDTKFRASQACILTALDGNNGITKNAFEKAQSSLNESGLYLKENAITGLGKKIVRDFMFGEFNDTKLKAFAGCFTSND